MNLDKRLEDLREASGTVTYSDPLTTFLYLLMRNDLPAGVVEKLVIEAVDSAEESTFTNGWLAHYAHNLSEELKNARVTHLKKALDNVFTAEEEAKKEKAMKEEKERLEKELEEVSETLTDEELANLKEKLIEASGVENLQGLPGAKETPSGEASFQEVIKDDLDRIERFSEGEMDNLEKKLAQATVESRAEGSNAVEKPAVDEAKEAIQEMVDKGHLSKEEAAAINEDIDIAVRPEAVEVKKDNEGHKITADEAKDMVETAVEEAELIEKWAQDKAKVESKEFFENLNDEIADKIGVPPVPDIETIEVIKNGEVTARRSDSIHGEKWKNTNEELQKIDEEKKSDEE